MPQTKRNRDNKKDKNNLGTKTHETKETKVRIALMIAVTKIVFLRKL